MEDDVIITRSKKRLRDDLGVNIGIKNSKKEKTSYVLKNMVKNGSNDKSNIIEMEIDGNILNTSPKGKKRGNSKNKTTNKKKDDATLKKKNKQEMIEKYGGYFDENDEFIIEDDVTDLEYSSGEDVVEPSKINLITNKSKPKSKLDLSKDELEMMTEEEISYWKKISKEERLTLKRLENELKKFDIEEIPERFKILKFPINLPTKRNIMNRLSQIEMMEPTDPEYFKLNKWVEGVIKIPFGKYIDLPITKNDKQEKIYEFISNVSQHMENSTYGHQDAKNKIMQIVCQWISNPKSCGNIIALQGPPGIGKTSLVKNGISKALNRPFHMIALGGATDSTFLEGHNYTYEGSSWGRIASILMDSQVMNPVIFFDELDKVSGTKQGEEIIGVLTHLTDQTQNSSFNDKYFSGIDLDLSRCLFVFSYNDESLINPILRDRLIKVHLKGFTVDEKLLIAKEYLLKELIDNIGISQTEFFISDEIIKEIVQKYTKEDGVRELRRCLETILLKINMAKFINPQKDLKICNELKDIKFPVNLTNNLVEILLKTKLEDNSMKNMMYI